MPAVIAVFITAAEAFAEVVVVVCLIDIITVIAVVRVLIGVRVLVVGTPAILPVCLSSEEALLVTVVYGPPELIGAVLIGVVVAAAPVVTIIRRRVEVWIAVVIVATVLETQFLLTFVR